MLVLTRKEGESILMELSNNITPEMTVSDLKASHHGSNNGVTDEFLVNSFL